MSKITLITGLILASVTAPAFAYIGPGAGAGAIAAVLGVIGAVFLALVGILWYPFKRMMAKRKAAANNKEKAE